MSDLETKMGRKLDIGADGGNKTQTVEVSGVVGGNKASVIDVLDEKEAEEIWGIFYEFLKEKDQFLHDISNKKKLEIASEIALVRKNDIIKIIEGLNSNGLKYFKKIKSGMHYDLYTDLIDKVLDRNSTDAIKFFNELTDDYLEYIQD